LKVLIGFKEFIARGNVVDLAVAVVIGAAFTALVTSMVEDLLTPVIAAIFGQADFSALSFTVNGSEFRYGNFLNALIAFLSVAAGRKTKMRPTVTVPNACRKYRWPQPAAPTARRSWLPFEGGSLLPAEA